MEPANHGLDANLAADSAVTPGEFHPAGISNPHFFMKDPLEANTRGRRILGRAERGFADVRIALALRQADEGVSVGEVCRKMGAPKQA